MTGSRLTVERVSRRFPGATAAAVDSASLVVDGGQILGLLGPSGAGKTTLLRLIAGFERPDRGTIRIADTVVSSPEIHVRPEVRGIGFVFQQGALFPHLSVRQNIEFGLRSVGATARQARVEAVAELCAITPLLARYPHELSGGEQQRAALARALARQVSVVLLDEPMSSVDVRLRAEIGAEVRRILAAAGTTAVFVTHDHADAFAIADTVAVMLKGTIAQAGTPEEIYATPASLDIARFIGVPNLLPARRRAGAVETEIGVFRTNGARNGGDDLVALVHDTDIGIETDPAGEATVESTQFQGDVRTYAVRLTSGFLLRCSVPANRAPAIQVGERVRVLRLTDTLTCFPAGGS